MKRPKKPENPDDIPQYITKEYIVAKDSADNPTLFNIETHPSYFNHDCVYCSERAEICLDQTILESKGLYINLVSRFLIHPIDFSCLQKIYQSLNSNFDIFVTDKPCSVFEEGAHMETILMVRYNVPNPLYNKGTSIYKQNLKKYHEKLAQYKEDLKKYNEYRSEQKKKLKLKEISRLESEIKKLKVSNNK